MAPIVEEVGNGLHASLENNGFLMIGLGVHQVRQKSRIIATSSVMGLLISSRNSAETLLAMRAEIRI